MAAATATRTRPTSTQTITTPSVTLSKSYKLDTVPIHSRIKSGLSRIYQHLIPPKADTDEPGVEPTPKPTSTSPPPQLPPVIAAKSDVLNGNLTINEQHDDLPYSRSSEPRQIESISQGPPGRVLQEGSRQGIAKSSDYVQDGTKKEILRFEGLPSKLATTSSVAPTPIPIPVDGNAEGQAATRHLVELPFKEHSTVRLSRSRKSYMDMEAKIPDVLSDEWNNNVKEKLDREVNALIKGMNGGKDHIHSSTQFYMVGTKHGDKLLAEPTIVISCGIKDCRRKLAARLNKINLYYLATFDRPICVRYSPQPASWAASSTEDAPFRESTAGIPSLQDVCVELSDVPAISGLKMRFDVLHAGNVQQRYATLGGIIGIDEAIFIMTTAHTFLADMRSASKTSSSEGISRTDSSSDSDGDAGPIEASLFSLPSPSQSTMNFSSLWTSKVKPAIAYSFLGEVAQIANSTSFTPSSSDWALFEVLNTHPLLSKFAISVQTSTVIPALQLTPGSVQILDNVNTRCTAFLTQTSASIHTGQAVMDVREVLLDNPLSPGASGAWIVRENNVCGYVVAITGSGRSCFMVTMEHVFREMETVYGKDVKFGRELKELIKENRIAERAFSSPPETPEDRVQQFGIEVAHDEIQPNNLRTMPYLNVSRKTLHRLSLVESYQNVMSIDPDDNHDRSVTYALESENGLETIESRIISRAQPNFNNAKLWSPRKKRHNFGVILLLAFLDAFASTMVAPSVPLLMRDLHSSHDLLGSSIVSIYVFGQITGPLLLVPLSNIYGRRIVYLTSNVVFIIFNIACSLAQSTSTLIAYRFFAGCAAACHLAVGHSSIEDMYFDKKSYENLDFLTRRRQTTAEGHKSLFLFKGRGQALAALTIASMLGSSIGPIPSGYLAEHANWRWVFRAIAILRAFGAVPASVLMRETNERINLQRSIARDQDLPRYQTFAALFTSTIPQAIRQPLRLLKSSPTMTILVLYLALMKGYTFLLYTTLTPIFTPGYSYATKWHLTPGKAGLAFLGIFLGIIIGSLFGCVIFQWARGWIDQRMERKGKAMTQYRQLPLVLSSLVICYGIVGFGWSVVKAKQLIVPLAAALLASLGTSLTVLTIEAYIVDVFVHDSADAIAASNFLGPLAGGLLPLFGQWLSVSQLGIQWTYTLFGIIALIILERTWYLWRNGKRLNKNPTKKSEERDLDLEELVEYELRALRDPT